MIEEFLKRNPDASLHYRNRYMWWSLLAVWKIWVKLPKFGDKELYAGDSLEDALRILKTGKPREIRVGGKA